MTSISNNPPLKMRNLRQEEIKKYISNDPSSLVEQYLGPRQVFLIFLTLENTLTSARDAGNPNQLVATVDKKAIQLFTDLVTTVEAKEANVGVILINSSIARMPSQQWEKLFQNLPFVAYILDVISPEPISRSLESTMRALALNKNDPTSTVIQSWLSNHAEKLHMANFVVIKPKSPEGTRELFPYNTTEMQDPLFSNRDRVLSLGNLISPVTIIHTTWYQILLPLDLIESEDTIHRLAIMAQAGEIKHESDYAIAYRFLEQVISFLLNQFADHLLRSLTNYPPKYLELLEIILRIAGCDHSRYLGQPHCTSLIIEPLNSYFNTITNKLIELPLHVHEEAYKVYKKYLENPKNDMVKRQFLTGLIYIVNHSGISKKIHLEILELIKDWTPFSLVCKSQPLLCLCLSLKHIRHNCEDEILHLLATSYFAPLNEFLTPYQTASTQRDDQSTIEKYLSPEDVVKLKKLRPCS